LEKVTIKNLSLEARKIGTWLQGIQGATYSSPWKEHARNSNIRAFTGVTLKLPE
jgi:hypothetical protein